MTVYFSCLGSNKDEFVIDSALVQQSNSTKVGNFTISGGQIVDLTNPGAYPYQVLISDSIILVDTSSSANTITMLASPPTGSLVSIKDSSNNASNNNITVDGNGNNINGQATFLIDVNGGAAAFIYNGTQWILNTGSQGPALPRVSSTTSISSPLTPNSNNYDIYCATAQAEDLTINADAGSPQNGQKLTFRFLDDGTARALTWTTGTSQSYRAIGVTLPTTTVMNKTVYVGCLFNEDADRWDAVAVSTEA